MIERKRGMKKGIVGKIVALGVVASVLVFANPGSAFAHVVVTPNEALTGAYETFTTSVPNEKDIPVTGLRLVIPDTIESVTPTVKPGWEIQTKKNGDKVTEISWTGGTIAPELRDEFTFSAHLPATSGDVKWKAYQTYQDGSVVSWDQQPSEEHGHGDEGKGPYSTTVVSGGEEETAKPQDGASNTVLYVISIAALVLGVLAVLRTTRK